MKIIEKKQIYEKYLTTHFQAAHENEYNEFKTYHKYFKINYSKHLNEDKKLKILDIGSGMGHFLYFLEKEGYKNNLGIDISNENIEFCKNKGFHVEYIDAFDFLEKNIEPFDVIVMNDIIEHFDKNEIVQILNLINNNLCDNGKVIVKTLNSSNPFLANSGRYIDFTHEISFTEESLSQILKVCSFEDVKVYPQDIYIFYTNPLNYIAKYFSKFMNLTFRIIFLMYGRKTKIFTKSIIAVGFKKNNMKI
ncbi:MAG: Ubiquinone biosynthesis O-methyltransferase [Candidatus Methanoperedens nitroreducens]|uniref:Ubiquinone biosynthesis O-methyltransferase n=1 Tax=Candidatus Methanoperedens nitratireducens TaxID=1392998 RepID=A0A0P8A4C6_9EURY|nr:class I SAM-dependent methyltransferase [Candidatus Methanoperedens sp. BLZ2]KAB2945331.1 MAG: class I SAM-dependent methyltransferase [Candidatus Methanoperedens sp.]KPQ43022.1 MAG: Ubiquinone biosynthesis O-methyltransferase [Candidatus Methanoperedens sp. BLZ1]MBZ0176560.1 class I SAM-dependent methyltransferase [Candidatus Methanoperedens nitroreducens]MCX9077878.1 class I SAM-dependent methyltransferase [Candidatus Methanoperedens sp.]